MSKSEQTGYDAQKMMKTIAMATICQMKKDALKKPIGGPELKDLIHKFRHLGDMFEVDYFA